MNGGQMVGHTPLGRRLDVAISFTNLYLVIYCARDKDLMTLIIDIEAFYRFW